MSLLNAPKLKRTGYQEKAEPGVWKYESSFEELDRLAEQIALEDSSHASRLALEKIPDFWARVVGFYLALTLEPADSDTVSLRLRARGAWRGFLAFLALRRVKTWNCGIVEISLGESTNSRRLVGTVRNLLPEGTFLSSRDDWRHLYMFMMGDLPIGMTSPLTLVCPNSGAAQSSQLYRVPWFDGEQFVDPIEKLNIDEKSQMACWVENVRSTISSNTSIGNSVIWNSMARELQEFKTDLIGSSDAVAKYPLEYEARITYWLFLPLAGSLAPSGEIVSDCVLEPRDKSARKPKLVILCPELDQQWGKPAKDIRVFGAFTLAELQSLRGNYGSDPERIGTYELHDSRRVRAADVFTGAMLLMPKSKEPSLHLLQIRGSAEIERIDRRNATPILPIKPEILDYLTPQQLAEACEYAVESDGRITVRVALPVSGGVCRIEKTFGEVHQIPVLPVLEVWPEFRSENWRCYYTFWDRLLNPECFYAYAPGDKAEVIREADPRGHIEREIRLLERAPEYLVCKRQPDAKDELGILLLAPAVIAPSQNSTWNIGIDFGTTNTNVYLRPDGNDAAERLDLSSGLRTVVLAEPADMIEHLHRYFLPTGPEALPVTPPFLSFLRSRSAMRADGGSSKFRPILDAHITFPRLDRDLSWLADTSISAYMKWDESAIGRLRVRAFMEEAALLAAAHAIRRGASSIQWYYAYPSAFKKELEIDNDRAWQLSISNVCKASLGGPAVGISKLTESVAAARYFHSQKKAYPAVGMIVVDIGGETTDLAIWHENNLIWQSSLRFAGRALIVDALLARPGATLKLMLPQSPRTQTVDSEQAIRKSLDAALGLLKQEELESTLLNMGGDTEVRTVLLRNALGLAGLFYYVGLVVRRLRERNVYRSDQLGVCLAGNGSKSLRWIPNDPTGFLARFISESSGIKVTADQILSSPSPKEEVAAGLVSSSALLPGSDVLPPSIVLGEKCEAPGTGDVPEADVQLFLQGIQLKSMDNITAFLKLFGEIVRQKLPTLLSDSARLESKLSKARSAIIQKLMDLGQSAKDGDVEIEPVFITGLKSLLAEVEASDVSRGGLAASTSASKSPPGPKAV
jgi:hypothetical protein